MLTIWAGEVARPHSFEGPSMRMADHDGAWEYPGGGGYPSTMTRVER